MCSPDSRWPRLLVVPGLFYGPPAEPGRIDRVSTLALAAYLLVAALLVLASRHDPVALTASSSSTIATVAIAWRTEAARRGAGGRVFRRAGDRALGGRSINLELLLAPSGPTAPAIPEPERFAYGSHLVLGAALAALFGGAGFLAQGRSDARWCRCCGALRAVRAARAC